MPHTSEKNSLRAQKCTENLNDFARMREWFPDRVNILSEGDSWFAYPKKWIVAGKPANLIDHITRWTRWKANFLSLASNGDEAVDMVSGRQKHQLIKLFRWHETGSREGKGYKPIHVLLFSGGGNDLVGENDFERFLLPYVEGATASECVDVDRLKRKARQIGYAYEELADIRDHYSPQTIIITHTYDYPYPTGERPLVLGGLIKHKGWMKRYMENSAINIPEPLQADVIKIFMNTVGEEIIKVGNVRDRFVVVDTRNTLIGQKGWLNEIHPTSNGFKSLAQKIYEAMVAEIEGLQP